MEFHSREKRVPYNALVQIVTVTFRNYILGFFTAQGQKCHILVFSRLFLIVIQNDIVLLFHMLKIKGDFEPYVLQQFATTLILRCNLQMIVWNWIELDCFLINGVFDVFHVNTSVNMEYMKNANVTNIDFFLLLISLGLFDFWGFVAPLSSEFDHCAVYNGWSSTMDTKSAVEQFCFNWWKSFHTL